MSKRMVFMGAGAVGGYVGGHIARTGEDVTLIDPWPEHIEYIKHNGIHLSGTQGEHTVRLKALHLHEVQSLFKTPVDIAFNGVGNVASPVDSTGWRGYQGWAGPGL